MPNSFMPKAKASPKAKSVATPKPIKPEKMAYEDFDALFQEASDPARSEVLLGPGRAVSAIEEAPCVAWVREMERRSESLEELAGGMWAGCYETPRERGGDDEDDEIDDDRFVDFDVELTPLAWAVMNGLQRTVEELLAAGADPSFSFNLSSCGGEDVEISIQDLARGWSEASYRAQDCAGLIDSALEARQIAKATRRAKPAKAADDRKKAL